MDNAGGMFEGGIVYSDLDVAQIERIPDEAFHRNVDLVVVAADDEGAHFFPHVVALNPV